MPEEAKTIESLNIQPPASIYRTFSRYNYKSWYAIAEFVDNSTASFYQHKKTLQSFHQVPLVVNIDYDQEKNQLIVTDNAYGMDLDNFRRAILLDARPENQTGRNEFGMGLKTAASWFGEVWSVSSTQYFSNKRYTATVNIPELAEKHLNSVDIIESPADPNEHGTIITITNITKPITGPKTVSKIKDVLRSMYRRDLNTGLIKIFYKNEELSFTPYEILAAKGIEYRKNLDFSFTFDQTTYHVTGFAALLGPKDSGFKKAGFALFRRDRVVIGSEREYYKPLDIFGEQQSPISHKLFGELNLDDFPINQAKDGFVWENGLEEVFVTALKNEIPDLIRFARVPIKQRENSFDEKTSAAEIQEVRKSTRKALEVAANGGTSIEDSANEISNSERSFIENFGSGAPEPPEQIYSISESTYEFKINGKSKSIKVLWTDAGSRYWFSYKTLPEWTEIKINIGHPFFKPYQDQREFRDILNRFVIAIYCSEEASQTQSNEEGAVYVDDLNNRLNEYLEMFAQIV